MIDYNREDTETERYQIQLLRVNQIGILTLCLLVSLRLDFGYLNTTVTAILLLYIVLNVLAYLRSAFDIAPSDVQQAIEKVR